MQACADRQPNTTRIRHKPKLIIKNMTNMRVAEAGEGHRRPSPLIWTG